MRQDLALIQAYNFIKAKDYSSADEFIKLHYPKDDATLKPLNLEAQRLGFNIKPVRIEEKTKPTTPRKAPTYRFQDFIFRSDFYQCRYSGMKLFSTPALIAISLYIPDAFPVFKIPNLPLKRNHQGVWTVGPSLDHKESLYAGGSNEADNLITASSTLNMVKGSRTINEMGWKILDENELDRNWDGGRSWVQSLMKDKAEFNRLILKAIELETFHSKINISSYFERWATAFLMNDLSNLSYL